jgi:chromate reductase
MTRILAISGCLRRASLNTLVLRAAAQLAPPAVRIYLYRDLADLPLFNPDLEEHLPYAVAHLRRCVHDCEGILIASPEYAHGVSGVMKNALDWLVGGTEFVGKPVALVNVSPRATRAHAALAETITVMSGQLVEETCATIPLLGSSFDVAGIIADPHTSGRIRDCLGVFQSAILRLAFPGAAAG